MFEHCWLIVLRGKMLRRLGPVYLLEIVSHRLLRYGSGILHVAAARLVARARRRGLGLRRRRSPRSSLLLLAARARRASASPATTRSSPGRRSSRSGTTSAAASPRTWERPRDAVNRALDVDDRRRSGSSLSSPFLALGALAVKLEDRGPVLYRQTRVGKDGADFELLKLRTMVVGAERRAPALRSTRAIRGSRGSGRVLRRLSLDELPQLWNVVRGEMSMIGPRPTLRYQVDAVRRAPAAPARRRPGHHRLGADPRPRVAAVGGADRARPLVRRATATGRPTCRSSLRTPLSLFGGTYKGERGGWRVP